MKIERWVIIALGVALIALFFLVPYHAGPDGVSAFKLLSANQESWTSCIILAVPPIAGLAMVVAGAANAWKGTVSALSGLLILLLDVGILALGSIMCTSGRRARATTMSRAAEDSLSEFFSKAGLGCWLIMIAAVAAIATPIFLGEHPNQDRKTSP